MSSINLLTFYFLSSVCVGVSVVVGVVVVGVVVGVRVSCVVVCRRCGVCLSWVSSLVILESTYSINSLLLVVAVITE